MQDPYMDSTHLIVNELTQLFVDNLVIEQVQEVTRRWHQPARSGDGPVIKRDRPWEHITYFTYSSYVVFRDPADGLFKCWYEDQELIPEVTGGRPWGWNHNCRQLYAYSEDGVHFVKPELGIHQVDHRDTNIIFGGPDEGSIHSASYIIDPYPPTPDRRFRMLYTHDLWGDYGSPQQRIRCAYSGDGIRWETDEDLPSFGSTGGELGDVSVLFYDHDARQFVQNTRHPLQGRGAINPRNPSRFSFEAVPHAPQNWAAQSRRRVFQSRSHDFFHWSDPVLVAAADDDQDNLDDSFYGMAQFKVGSTHFACVGVLHMVDQTRDVQLLVSHDGLRWKQTNKSQPFIAPRGAGYWDGYMQAVCSPPIEVGEELWFYHGGSACTHDMWRSAKEGISHPELEDPSRVEFSLGLAKLRKDGFASLDTNPYREGIVVTRPLVGLGTRLVINARCRPGGSVRVEVADKYDDPIEPCTLERCDPFTGDSTAHVVTWEGSPDVPAGHEERRLWRKLRFFLRNAELFSFRFEGAEGKTPSRTGFLGTISGNP